MSQENVEVARTILPGVRGPGSLFALLSDAQPH